ncbi:hypothetical protein GCK32_001347 [Trichostrongylus colubriformis]|uniref:Piwi domain-containing protein n=1 Tax=Trichostrongylus colubriformis TaxID=6319 RepID=A0AAN8FXG6_TRICO
MGTGVIMQMPRGNLETIHPRPFVIRVIKQLLDAGKFVEALKEMKKHRIDMNLIVDYKPEMFIANISKLMATVKDVELICILIAALTNERSMWCDGDVISDKVNRIAGLLIEEVLKLSDDRRVEMFVVLLSALLKSSPPQVERALRLIKKETDKMSTEKRDLYTRKWIHHVRFFVDEARLFNAALATYDLNLALQVAEVSNRDPKEYVPLLNELRKVEPEDYRKYRIDLFRSDWESALKHLSYLDDKWDEAVGLIREKNLYSAALIFYKESSKYKVLHCLEMSGNIDRYHSQARILEIPDEQIGRTLNKMAAKLKISGRWSEAAKALKIANASPESLIEAYAKAAEWTSAVDVAERLKDTSSVKSLLVDRAHTILKEISTRLEQLGSHTKRLEIVRGMKKERIINVKDGIETGGDLEIDRKKQSLKEGGEYEDSALLISLAAHYKWMDEVTAELMQLLPALVQVDEVALARSTQLAADGFFVDLVASRSRIWPNKLHPWDLPGPIYALYNINDAFTFPSDGGMPEVVTLEPEMIAPNLDTNRKWKLQILSDNNGPPSSATVLPLVIGCPSKPTLQRKHLFREMWSEWKRSLAFFFGMSRRPRNGNRGFHHSNRESDQWESHDSRGNSRNTQRYRDNDRGYGGKSSMYFLPRHLQEANPWYRRNSSEDEEYGMDYSFASDRCSDYSRHSGRQNPSDRYDLCDRCRFDTWPKCSCGNWNTKGKGCHDHRGRESAAQWRDKNAYRACERSYAMEREGDRYSPRYRDSESPRLTREEWRRLEREEYERQSRMADYARRSPQHESDRSFEHRSSRDDYNYDRREYNRRPRQPRPPAESRRREERRDRDFSGRGRGNERYGNNKRRGNRDSGQPHRRGNPSGFGSQRSESSPSQSGREIDESLREERFDEGGIAIQHKPVFKSCKRMANHHSGWLFNGGSLANDVRALNSRDSLPEEAQKDTDTQPRNEQSDTVVESKNSETESEGEKLVEVANTCSNSKSQMVDQLNTDVILAPKKKPASRANKERVKLLTNFWEVNVHSKIVYRYDVAVYLGTPTNDRAVDCLRGPRDDSAMIAKRKLCLNALQFALNFYRILSEGEAVIHDGASMMFSSEDLADALKEHRGVLTFDVPLLPEQLRAQIHRVDVNTLTIEITPCRDAASSFDIADLSAQKNRNWAILDRSWKQFYELLTSQDAVASGLFTQFGAGCLYSRPALENIGYGFERFSGAQKGIKFIEGRRQQLGDVVAALIIDRVRMTYLGTASNPISFVAAGISRKPIMDLKAVLPNNARTEVSMLTKFSDTKTRINPYWPAVEWRVRGRTEHFPMELLQVEPNQRVPLEKQINAKAAKRADRPESRFANITGLLEALNLHDNASRNKFLRAFGVTISYVPKTVEGFRRQAPQISYSGNRPCVIDTNKYNWREGWDTKYVEGAKLDRIIVVHSDRSVPKLVREPLEKLCRNRGVSCGAIDFVPIQYRDTMEMEEQLEKVFFQNKSSKELLHIIFIDRAENKSHEFLKLLERKYLIRTQQLTTELAYKLHKQPQSCANFVSKTNLKLGGINYEVIPETFAPTRDEIMNKMPPQKPSVVGVEGAVLNARFKWMLDLFRKNRGVWPESVVITRDGVSEGQYRMVIEDELFAIKVACEEYGNVHGRESWKPRFTVVVTTKRHNARFFVEKRGIENPKPATVVDTDVVRNDITEFYMQSHHPVQASFLLRFHGTAKPTSYQVIVDENDMTMDEVQSLMLALTFHHQISSGPVSLPEPVYQADEWAKRGKNMWSVYTDHHNPLLMEKCGEYAAPPINFEAMTHRLAFWNTKLQECRVNA